MIEKMPRTPLSTPLSGSARETEFRLRNIFSGPKKRPPLLALALMGALCLLCGNMVSCGMAEPEVSPSSQPSPAEIEEERASLQRAAEEKLNGYLWPRESIQQDILGEEMEFVLYRGNGWTMYVPADWETGSTGAGRWTAPSQNVIFSVDKHFRGTNPQEGRARRGVRRCETDYDPPFDYYYEETWDDVPDIGSSRRCIYFFAPAGEQEGYEFTLCTTQEKVTEAEKRIQEAMLLSFRLDDSSRALNYETYTPGQTQWEAAMTALTVPTERIWYRGSSPDEIKGREDTDCLSYVLELGKFQPEEFIQYFNWEMPVMGEDGLHLYLPELRIWLDFYSDTSWVCLYHAGEYYWAEFHDPDDPDRFMYDIAKDWLAAEEACVAE